MRLLSGVRILSMTLKEILMTQNINDTKRNKTKKSISFVESERSGFNKAPHLTEPQV